MSESNEDELDKTSDPNWFRAPSRRERRIAAAVFIGFGLFFIALFVVLSGWWFRWVILVLAGYLVLEGLRLLGGSPTAMDSQFEILHLPSPPWGRIRTA